MDIDKIEELTELTRKWFLDRDITQGDIFKQTLKLFEEMGELVAGYVKQKEQLTKDSIGDCAVVVVGLAMMIEIDPVEVFNKAVEARKGNIKDCFELMIENASEFQFTRKHEVKTTAKFNLYRIISYLKAIAHKLGYDFVDCFELAYNEIEDRKGKWIDGTFVKEEDLLNVDAGEIDTSLIKAGNIEVEKEKRYLVKMKNLRALFCYLGYIPDEGYWTLMASGGKSTVIKHTRKELEDAGFGEVFNCPLFEIEEVEG